MKHQLYVIKISIIFGAIFCCAKNSVCQQKDSSFQDFNYIKSLTGWGESLNPTQLKNFPLRKISSAEVFYKKSDGSFKDYSASDNSFEAGIESESFFRLNRNVVFYGAVDYRNFKGKNMQGSALINPYTSPLGFAESADSNAGTKKLEQYSLNGALSAHLSNRIILGGQLSYQAADYAKLKDLRHINSLLNMDAGTGITYLISEKTSLGASYHYKRRIESLKFEIHGNTDRQYLVFIDYGNFYGKNELFGEDGLTDERRPIVNNTHQGAIQLGLQLNSHLNFQNEFSFGTRNGYYGKKGSSAIKFTEHEAAKFTYSGILTLRQSADLHRIKLNLKYEDLLNRENIYSSGTTPGGNSIIIYHGKNEIFSQQVTSAQLGYRGFLHVDNFTPEWVIEALVDFGRRDQKTTIFPFYRTQTINTYGVSATVLKNFKKDQSMYTAAINAGYRSGSGQLAADAYYQTPSSDQRTPISRDFYLQQEYEFLTATRLLISPELKYSQLISPRAIMYIKGAASLTRAFGTKYLGPYQNTVKLSIGWNF